MEIIKLEKEFVKKNYEGHRNPVRFIQLEETENAYLYKREIGSYVDYEVFVKTVVKCKKEVDGKFISTGVEKEKYPRATAFGKWAWSYKNKDKAYMKLKELNPVPLI